MFKVLRDWVQRYFSDEEAVVLAVLLFLAFTAVLTLGGMLAPVLAGMVLAFLMQGLVNALERVRVPTRLAVMLVFALFMGALAVFMLVLVPLLREDLVVLGVGMAQKGGFLDVIHDDVHPLQFQSLPEYKHYMYPLR